MLSNNPGLWSKFHAPWKILKKREVTVLSHETGGEERCGCTMSDEHYHHIIIINNKKAGPTHIRCELASGRSQKWTSVMTDAGHNGHRGRGDVFPGLERGRQDFFDRFNEDKHHFAPNLFRDLF